MPEPDHTLVPPMGLTNLLDADYIAGLNDDEIVQLFFHGDPNLTYETIKTTFSSARSSFPIYSIIKPP